VDRDTLAIPLQHPGGHARLEPAVLHPGEFRPDPQAAPKSSIAAPIWWRASAIAAPATRRRTGSAPTEQPAFQGGNLQSWFAPNITGDPRRGIGGWSVEEIVEYLKTGRNATQRRQRPDGGGGDGLHQPHERGRPHRHRDLSEGARRAAGPVAPAPLAATDPRMRAGEAIYADTCMACHVRNGEGVDRMFPRLAGNAVVSRTTHHMLRIVISGVQSAATDAAPTGPAMPSLGWRLSDKQVADVLTYIRNSWGNAAAPTDRGSVPADARDRGHAVGGACPGACCRRVRKNACSGRYWSSDSNRDDNVLWPGGAIASPPMPQAQRWGYSLSFALILSP
jgi:mono/diheme cytochrome c family protein